MSYQDFIKKYANVSDASLDFISRMWRNFWAASMDTNADVMVLHPDVSQSLPEFEHLPRTGAFDGPVASRMVQPWIKYLSEHGVKFVANTGVSAFEFSGHRVVGAHLSTGKGVGLNLYMTGCKLGALHVQLEFGIFSDAISFFCSPSALSCKLQGCTNPTSQFSLVRYRQLRRNRRCAWPRSPDLLIICSCVSLHSLHMWVSPSSGIGWCERPSGLSYLVSPLMISS